MIATSFAPKLSDLPSVPELVKKLINADLPPMSFKAYVNGSAAVNTTVSIYAGSSVTTQGSAPASGVAYPIASVVSVPPNASLIVTDKTTAIYLTEGQAITVTSGTASGITYSISYELIA